SPERLSEVEARALAKADALFVTGAFQAEALGRLALPPRPLLCVEPAREVEPAPRAAARPADEPLRALLVNNVIERKGVLSFLQALAAAARPDEALRVSVVGGRELEPAYAEACERFVASHPTLRALVRFEGELDPADCARRMRESDLFVSASRMESFGMALAEARSLGLPLVVRAGGHAGRHVDEAAGGVLCADEAEVAFECLSLARDRAEFGRRAALAAARPLPVRTWADAAADYLSQAGRAGLLG
ncbi:MAG TPA: glycosyltransferase, partial [Polyangiaceae bacterium]|nr:glycosyltransferase [Polyangiaceae bacterium]